MFRVIRLLFGCDHDDIRRFGDGRMWVECLKCGRETCGIGVATKRTVVARSQVQTRRLRLKSAA